MSKVLITESILSGIADAIREKDGSTAKITPANMATKISAIETGGGTDDVAATIVNRTITEYENNSLTTVGPHAFYGCSSLTNVKLPACTSIDQYAFTNCSNLTAIHLGVSNKTSIEANTSCSSKWGASNAKVTFDLNAAKVTFSDTDLSIYVNKKALGADATISGADYIYLQSGQKADVIAVDTSLHAIYIDSVTPSSNTDMTKEITRNRGWSNYIRVTGPSEAKFKVYYDDILVDTITGTEPYIYASDNISLTVKISASGYKSTTVTFTMNDHPPEITMEEGYFTYNLTYPFTDHPEVLANLVDGSNFVIAESPSVQSGSDIEPSIVSGPKSYTIDDGVSFGYIKFHTLETEDTDMLTVSVTCNAYAESKYDTGVVFIDTSLHKITSTLKLKSNASGTDNSTYGHILYNSYGESSTEYSTYTYALKADTDYYLHFVYSKDSSNTYNWDRLSITNIKFTDDGTSFE